MFGDAVIDTPVTPRAELAAPCPDRAARASVRSAQQGFDSAGKTDNS